ncbi:acetyltransferase GNAT domain containing protein [Nitzschia inconspicua]|uniref:histone acetyltransferase n=1 Tax=Nitzschia inconspicua TaxID=303405 RepID=A0A9K3P7U0_9STRA|nr:acyl-CoA N-acyltransferase [Nitzschia inconspicua]KAG7367481.1 acetyltransferase GNAT domain containing protein [Nitzschia inconspicua]
MGTTTTIEEFYRRQNKSSSREYQEQRQCQRRPLSQSSISVNVQARSENTSAPADSIRNRSRNPYWNPFFSLLSLEKKALSSDDDVGDDDDDEADQLEDEIDQESLLQQRHYSSSQQSSKQSRGESIISLYTSSDSQATFIEANTQAKHSEVIQFRAIQPKDRIQIQQLHEQWFPVEYQQEFYDDLCLHQRMCHSGHELYTMVATIPKTKSDLKDGNTDDQSNENMNKNDDGQVQYTEEEEEDPFNCSSSDERIIACLVGCVLGAHKINSNSRKLLVPAFPQKHSKLFYIMTLGTVSEYRHLGLATQLVQNVIQKIVQRDAEIGTIYLHVITYNEAAIRFYEDKLGFWKVQEIPQYYSIDGNTYNCYLYAKYFHGNRGHLDFLKVVTRWLTSLWASISSQVMFKSRN